MNRIFACLLLTILGTAAIPLAQSASKEFLTPKEIEKVQLAQQIDARVKVYMEAAAFRLKTARERFGGVESEPGAPLEFFTVEEMIEGYNLILQSVMMNLEDAYQDSSRDREKVKDALTSLKKGTQNAENALAVLKKLAEERLDEKVWNQVNQAIEITTGALEGAELGLSELSQSPDKNKMEK